MRVFKRKLGFTLVEMLVTMSVLAVLSLITATAMISSRNNNRVEETATGLLTTVRDAQNRALSVEKRDSSEETKIWGVRIKPGSPGEYQLITYYPDSNSVSSGTTRLAMNSASTPKTPLCGGAGSLCTSLSDMSVSIMDTGGSTGITAGQNIYMVFNTPFARPYIITDNDGCIFQYDGEKCRFTQNDIIGDWSPHVNGSNPAGFSSFLDKPDRKIMVTITYRGNTQRVVIKANGDSYVQ